MNARAVLIALLLIGFASFAHAQTFGLNTVSLHVPRGPDQNNVNPGVYARFDNGLTLGTYRNTWRRQSLLIAYQYDFNATFGLLIGAVSGYQKRIEVIPCQTACYEPATHTTGFSHGYFTPVLAPTIAFPAFHGFTPRMTFIPGVGGSSVFHLSVEKSFGH